MEHDMSYSPADCNENFGFENFPGQEELSAVLETDPVDLGCGSCNDHGIVFSDDNEGLVKISFCERCSTRKSESWDKHVFNHIKVPVKYIGASGSEVASIPDEVLNWMDEGFKGSVFLTGYPGVGKTFISFYVLFNFLRKCKEIKENSCYYVQCSDLSEAYDLNQKSKFDPRRKNYRIETYIKRCLDAELLIVDELGLKKGDPEYLFKIIDQRINTSRATIFISNHTFEKKYSYNGKTLENLLGSRIESRLKDARNIKISGPDKRGYITKITREEAMEWVFPKNILQMHNSGNPLSEYRTHLLDWMIRNPVFEPIDSKKRKKYTEIKLDSEGNEIIVDKHRESEKVVQGLWFKNDLMSISGPRCGYDDAILYQTLLNMLAEQHSRGNRGIVLKTNLYRVLKKLNLRDDGLNYRSLERKLLRLVKVNITYYREGKLRWCHGLLSGYSAEEGEITFNKYMIPFYKEDGSYTIYDKKKLETLSGYGALIYYFLSSHENPEAGRHKPLEFWKTLLSLTGEELDKSSTDSIRRGLLDVSKKTGFISGVSVSRGRIYYEVNGDFEALTKM